MDYNRIKRRKIEIDEINELLENNIEIASNIHMDIEKCINPTVLEWLRSYDDHTNGQTLSLYFAFMTTIAHLSMSSNVMQWNKIPRCLNLYSIILGYSGVTKSGCVRECREALEELYEFLVSQNIAGASDINSILDKFTEAGLMDQLKESSNVIIVQEEIDLALKQMSFFSNNTADSGRQIFCQLFDGLTLRKKTKGYRQKIRNARMTLCGTSTGVLLPTILQDFLKHAMTDGAVVRCLFLVLGYQKYIRKNDDQISTNMPTIAQLLLAVYSLGRRKYLYTDESQLLLDNYIEELTKQASSANSSRLTSFLAKQPTQITRITAITQIIDLLPSIMENVNIIRASDDMIGLNIRLVNEISNKIRRLFQPEILISTASIRRAIYLHGYLLEQTLQIFDISSLQSEVLVSNTMNEKEMQHLLARQILLLPKVIITKENLYSINENKKIDRNIGKQSFETLVTEGLLLKDYFILTSTRRPIQCYAKVLPSCDISRHSISNKLQPYNIQLSDYTDISQSVGIQSSSKLSPAGERLFSTLPYSTICDTTVSLTSSLTTVRSIQSLPLNTNPFRLTELTADRSLNERQNDALSSTNSMTIRPNRILHPNTILRTLIDMNGSNNDDGDIADDNYIISMNNFISQ